MSDRALIIFPDGRVDEIDGQGNTTGGMAPGVWDELVEAGYPLFSDGTNPEWGEKCFDVSVEDGQVTAYSVSEEPGNREHPMGAVTLKLAAWLALTVLRLAESGQLKECSDWTTDGFASAAWNGFLTKDDNMTLTPAGVAFLAKFGPIFKEANR